MAVDRLYTFSLGGLLVPLELMCPGWDPADIGPIPVPTILAHAPEGWFLFDLGLSTDFRRKEVYGDLLPWGAPLFPGDGEPLLELLAACGVGLGDLHAVVLSHLHNDHTGGLRYLAGRGIPVLVQQAELDQVAAGQGGPFVRPEDWEPFGVELTAIAGETRIATGITAIPSPGHTRGHQSFLVELAGGERILFAYDAIPLTGNLERGVATAVTYDPALALATQEMLVARAQAEGARIVPGHCARAWAGLPQPPAFLG